MSEEHTTSEPVASDRSGMGFLVGYAARLVWRGLDERLGALGLEHDSYILMANVALEEQRAGVSPRVADLVSGFALDPHHVDEAARRLARLGLVETLGEGEDGYLRLQPRGRALMDTLFAEARWLLESALSGFTYAEIDELSAYLRGSSSTSAAGSCSPVGRGVR